MAAHRIPRRRIWRLSYRALALVVAVVAAVAAGAGVAMAYWSSSGSGTATATTGTLAAPIAVSGAQTAGTGSVTVSWTASAGTPSPTGYYVTRKDASNNVVAACGTSASSTTALSTCTDSSVPLGDYTYTVVAVYHTWTATSAPSASVTVGQAAQAITFTSTAPADATVGGADYTVTANGGGSGNPVTFSSTTPGVCTVTGSTVSFGHAGACTVNADQAGSAYYSAATTAQQTFTVAKATQTISFTSTVPTDAVVGGAGYTVAAAGGASGNPVIFSIDAVATSVCSISGATVTFQHVGTCVVDANQTGNSDYLAANQVQQSIAVGKGSQAISFTTTPPSTTQIGGSYTPAATSTSGLAVTISLGAASTGCTLTGGTVNFTAAGPCVIDADQAGNADYLAAAQMQQSFTVSKVNQTISFTSSAPTTATVGGPVYTAAATATSGLTVSFSSATPGVCTSGGTNGATFSFIAVGTCTVNADQVGDGTYGAAPQVQQSFTIGKGSQTITFTSTAPTSATVGSAGYTPTATSTSNLTVAITLDASSTGCTLTSGTVNFTAAGTCRIDANQAGDANYNAAPQVQQSIPVTNSTTAITSLALANGAGKVLGQPDGTDTITIGFSGGLSVSSICSAWSGNTTNQSDATADVSISNTGSGNNVLSLASWSGCPTFHLGTVDLGSSAYVTSTGSSHQPVDFSASTIAYNATAHTIKITLGTPHIGGSNGTVHSVPSSVATLTLSGLVNDANGQAVSPLTFATGNVQQF